MIGRKHKKAQTQHSPPPAAPERTEARRPPEAPRAAPAQDLFAEESFGEQSFEPQPAPRSEPTPQARGAANIGKSIHIKGELNGNEDLTIDGTIEGRIVLQDHNLTIGQNGKITAEISAKSVVVVGHVIGDIHAEARIEVRDGGTVEGDLHAPRVVLAEGARFKGSIDMLGGGAPSRPKPAQPARASQDEVPPAVVEQIVDDVLDDIVADPNAGQGQKGKDAKAQGQKNDNAKGSGNDKPQNQKGDQNAKGNEQKGGDKQPKASNSSKLAGMFDEFDPTNP